MKLKRVAARLLIHPDNINQEISMHAFTSEVAVDSNPAISVGVQTWSRGELFPAVISRVEVYDTPATFVEWMGLCSQLAQHAKRDYLYRNYLANFYARTLDERLLATKFSLSMPNRDEQFYSTYDEAASAARSLNEYDAARAHYLAQLQAANAAARALEAGRNPRDLAAAWIDGMREAA